MLPTVLEGACTHNLKDVDVTLRPGEVVAITGISGAGKSSLALDTLYAEGQRRFVESFSPYARQFLERLERPPTKRLEPVPAAIAVDRRSPVKSSRSTLATMADLEPYLAALFTREARPVCPEHGLEAVELDTARAAVEVQTRVSGARATLTYPVRVSGTEAYLELRERLTRDGYRRLWLAGEVVDVDRVKPSAAVAAASVEVVIDRVQSNDTARLAAGIELAWAESAKVAHVHANGTRVVLPQGLSCPSCAAPFERARAGLFSYESPLGACPECRGFGRTLGIDLNKVIPDAGRSLAKLALRPWAGKSTSWERGELAKLCKRHGVPLDRPWSALTSAQQKVVLEGDGSWRSGKFPGILGWFRWLETRTYKMHVRVLLSRYRSYDPCRVCAGQRLNPRALTYRVGGKSLADFHALEVREAHELARELRTQSAQGEFARKELASRLAYLERVGLGYLRLDRQARTLSGGEAQRVTLTFALGTSLHNTLFVLDEPSVGLHPADVPPLAQMIRELAERDNIVLVVEHDPTLIRAADRVIELGPGAGSEGGRVVLDASPARALSGSGATARALRARPAPRAKPRRARGKLRIRGARAHNLSGFDVDIPLGVLCAITGPSGSGKTTLCVDIVYRALARRLGALDVEPAGAHDALEGAEGIRRIALVDQSPLGRTSRGNAATYTKAWDFMRAAYAREPEAVARRLSPSHFSFNVDGGRCDDCSGEGYETVEMQFLADVRLVCPVCRGRRFKPEVLEVRHRGKTIAELLESTVADVLELYRAEPAVQRALGPVVRLGLGYLRLGQPLSTLSGGEAQRLKLARALSDEQRGALLVLDEPSAGLHADEVERLLSALDSIIGAGASVLVIEHDLDVIANADHVVDLGPGAGSAGGTVVAQGTPAGVSQTTTATGRALLGLGQEHPAVASVVSARAARPRGGAKQNGKAPAVSPGAALEVVRAREHNLQEVSVRIPHGKFTVLTGPSGSGKSTLAFDVVFAEGQRRFLDTLTPYARQFLPTLPRPDVDVVSGVPPAIALEQRTSRAGGSSTVATVTEVAHYLRLLYAKLGVAHCPEHDAPIHATSAQAIIAQVQRCKGKFTLLAPVVRARKGTYLEIFEAAARNGIESALCDGVIVSTEHPPKLARSKEHTIDWVVLPATEAAAIPEACLERALELGRGSLKLYGKSGAERAFSRNRACPTCGFSVPELDPRWFSFSTKQGRCSECEGHGVVEALQRKRGRKSASVSEARVCEACQGARLSPVPRAVRVAGERYHELSRRSVRSALARVSEWRFPEERAGIAEPIVAELGRRLEFLQDVGLDYLSLDRPAATLSGGEMQRLRLAAQLGAGLTGALYVLDEPTIGLHPRDTRRLLDNLGALTRLGSTVLVVEHDADTIRAADHLIDLGPGGGARGGCVMAQGTPAEVLAEASSPTARALADRAAVRTPLPIPRDAEWLTLSGVTEHNLKSVELCVPLGRFTVVAGVSGSGKSTLVRRVLLPALRAKLGLSHEPPGRYDELTLSKRLRRAVSVDQSPIGRTPRSVPATFLGVWDAVRRLFAATPDAQVAGFGASRFSFNTPAGGRCTTCDGQGVITHEMSFLPDVVTPCADCSGQRFEPRTLSVRYRGLSVGDVLGLTVEDAVAVFQNHPSVSGPLQTLTAMGAGYLTLGQGSHTLSGGEAQRLKLALELTASSRHEPTLYVLDEPTTGLHIADVSKLMAVLSRLVERGDTLVVIEHHPLVIGGADFVVELCRRKTPTAEVLRDVLVA
ncbi:MAG TPA: excinuclease ABC subunit UvrA [Polyangiaceae bacterium]